MFFCESLLIAGACLTGAQLDYLTVSPQDTPEMVAYSYDGVARDVSRFYKPEDPSIKLGASFFIDDDIKITAKYDNGYKAQKYEVEDSLAIQYTQVFDITDNTFLTFSGGTTIGGGSEHESCKDSYGREYYCGSLTAWSDFKQTDDDTPYNVSFTVTKRF